MSVEPEAYNTITTTSLNNKLTQEGFKIVYEDIPMSDTVKSAEAALLLAGFRLAVQTFYAASNPDAIYIAQALKDGRVVHYAVGATPEEAASNLINLFNGE